MEQQFVESIADCDHSVESWRAAFDRLSEGTAMEVHAVELVDVDADRIVLEMPMGDHARQVMGLLHGGISAMLAETAASMHACWGVDVTKKAPVGTDLNATHVRSASEGTIRVVGRALRRGRTHVQHRVQIRHADRDELLTECRVTNYLKPVDFGD